MTGDGVEIEHLDGQQIELRPNTIEQALIDCQHAINNPRYCVVPTARLFVDMLEILVKLKHS